MLQSCGIKLMSNKQMTSSALTLNRHAITWLYFLTAYEIPCKIAERFLFTNRVLDNDGDEWMLPEPFSSRRRVRMGRWWPGERMIWWRWGLSSRTPSRPSPDSPGCGPQEPCWQVGASFHPSQCQTSWMSSRLSPHTEEVSLQLRFFICQSLLSTLPAKQENLFCFFLRLLLFLCFAHLHTLHKPMHLV